MEKLIVKWAFLLCFISVSMNITMAQTQEKSPVKAPQAQSNPGRIAAEPSQVICDALLLDNTKANEIKKLYNEAREEVIAKMKKEPNSSPDKINTAMGKSYSEIAVLFKQKITGKLPDNAIQAIEPILAHRSITTIAELRALRFVQLQETQQAEIQPYSINLVLAGIPGATMKPEEVQEKVQEEKTKYLEKVTSILTPEQKNRMGCQNRTDQKRCGNPFHKYKGFQGS